REGGGGRPRAPVGGVGVEENGGAVQTSGIARLGEGVAPLRPERLGWETFCDRDRHFRASCVRSQTTARRNGSQLPRVEQPFARGEPTAGATVAGARDRDTMRPAPAARAGPEGDEAGGGPLPRGGTAGPAGRA